MSNIFDEGRVLLIDKPYDWTSFDVVREIRNMVKTKKIGHAGTLDPLATGLLILCTGKFTKKINDYMAQEKEYTGIIVLGATTPTYDLESIPENFADASQITAKEIEEAARSLTGMIMQVPPIYSAIKKDGKRAYELARRGQEVELKARPVTITRFETRLYNIKRPDRDGINRTFTEVAFTVTCSAGTYIRTLAHDLGGILGCGGYLSALCRTRIGSFELKDAWRMDGLQQKIEELVAAGGHLLSPGA